MSKTKGRVKLTVDEEICKGCGLCILVCPLHAMGESKQINTRGFHPAELARPDECTACAQCALMCPDVCIRIVRSQ